MNESTSHTADTGRISPGKPNRSMVELGLIMLFVLILQLWSRYLPTPWAVFVADDWENWARSSFYNSHGEAFLAGLQDPNRPLSMAAVEVGFRLFGNHPFYWTLISVAANTLLLSFLMKMAWGLTGRKVVVLIAGTLFAILPTLTETYHWSTQVLNEVACALMLYAFSGWMWIDYARRGGAVRFVLSVVTYMIALFSYEAGILLPAAYVFLLPWRHAPWRNMARLSAFGLVAVFYATWRGSNAFGMNVTWHYPPHMEAGISPLGIVWNVRELINWWAGDYFFGAILNGLESFSTLSPWTRRILVVGNGLIVGVLGWLIKRNIHKEEATAAFSSGQVALFVMTWTGAALAIPAISYSASRLMVLPAIGIVLGFAILLSRQSFSIWGSLLYVPVVISMVANQGTAESYRQAGELNQKLYAHVCTTMSLWREKDILLLDTRSIRHRLTPGLTSPVGTATSTWADYRNSLLLRGFVLSGMVRMALQEPIPSVLTILDVECGARNEDGVLLWHERFDPGRPYQTPMDRVFTLDAGAILWEK